MELSLRLSAIADMVTEGNRLVDVGCDHGYLPVYLIQKKKIMNKKLFFTLHVNLVIFQSFNILLKKELILKQKPKLN